MSTMPAKHHQPLHNFTLPFLKWGQRLHVNHHCRRRSINSDRKPHRNHNNAEQETDEQNGAVLPDEDNRTKNFKLIDVEVEKAVNGDAKPWNLRPRRLTIDSGDTDTVAVMTSARSGRLLREENEELRKKKRLWISLSKEEIEEDIYAFTGSRPVRRPKKRSKIEQKQLDDVFPGLYLVGISADSYRV